MIAARLLIVCSIAISAAIALPAAAAPPDDMERAKVHFRVGEGLYQLGSYADALREFSEGYRLAPRPVFLLNIGQAHRKLHDPRRALESFSRYLEVASAEDPRRREVEEIVTALRAELDTSTEPPPKAPTPPPRELPSSLVATPTVVSSAPSPTQAPRRRWVLPVALSASGLVVLGVALGVGLTYGVNRFDCAGAAGCLDVKQGP